MTSVLIIDDDPVICKKLEMFFTSELNMQISGTAANGRIGLELLKKQMPDLITLDIQMPVQDGLTALKEILAYNSEEKVIMVSAIKDSNKINQALLLGAKNYIEKPLTLDNVEYVQELKGIIMESLEDG